MPFDASPRQIRFTDHKERFTITRAVLFVRLNCTVSPSFTVMGDNQHTLDTGVFRYAKIKYSPGPTRGTANLPSESVIVVETMTWPLPKSFSFNSDISKSKEAFFK